MPRFTNTNKSEILVHNSSILEAMEGPKAHLDHWENSTLDKDSFHHKIEFQGPLVAAVQDQN